MKWKSLLSLFLILSLFSCQNAPVKSDEKIQKIFLNDASFKELETFYKGATIIYEFSKEQEDFGSYLKEKNLDISKLIELYQEVKSTWESIKELKNYYASTKELFVNLETVKALKESAIGLTLKLDDMLADHIRDFNKKYLTQELIEYYTLLIDQGVDVGERLYQLQEKWRKLNEPKESKPSRIPTNATELRVRYEGCSPCNDFYLGSEGANYYIDYHEQLMEYEQFPGILEHLTFQMDRETGLRIDAELIRLLDVLKDYQQNKCTYENKAHFRYAVDKAVRHWNSLGNLNLYLAQAGTRRKRLEYIKEKLVEPTEPKGNKYTRRKRN